MPRGIKLVTGETHLAKALQKQSDEISNPVVEREKALRPLPLYPSLYQINTRVWLPELSKTLGRTATLDDVPDAELDRFAEMGFDWIWFLSVMANGCRWTKAFPQQSRVAEGIPGDFARPV